MKQLFKTTVIGGVLFLLPVAVVLLVLGHAFRLALKLVRPISDGLDLDRVGTVAGLGISTLLAVLVLILVSLAAGVVARTTLGMRVSSWFENSIVGGLPQYRMVRTMAEGLVQVENSGSLRPSLISIEGGWQIGYLVEELANGWVAVFLPQAPTPLSGTVMYFEADRVRPLGITMVQAASIVKRIGTGSGEALRGVNMALPGGH